MRDEKRHTITIRQTIEVEQVIDVVAYFAGLDEKQREQYTTMDPDDRDLFMDGNNDWHWPLAYMLPPDQGPEVHPEIVWPLPAGALVRDDVTEDGAEVHMYSRPFEVPLGKHGYRTLDWCEADFEYLRSQVPWLDAFHTRREFGDAEEQGEELIHSRIPGPNDVPLFG